MLDTNTFEASVTRYESPDRDVFGSIPERSVRDVIAVPVNGYYWRTTAENDGRKMLEIRTLKGFSPERELSALVRIGDVITLSGREYTITGIEDFSPSPFSETLPDWFGSSFDAEVRGEVVADA